MNSVISEEMALDLQQSLQAIRAVESPQPHEILSSSIDWHRGSDYYLHESTDKECLRWLLLFTDIRAQSNNKQSIPSGSRLKAFLAISNAVKTSPDSPPVSLANFLTGSCEAGFELMEGEGGFAQSLALQACRSSFNLPYLISLLGQGYKLVISGHRFGGIVAHALSTQLLLQVKSEILLAEKMGVDLSSLALTHEGVTSFALSSPLFASGSLGGVLDAHGLSGALNTLWHKQDRYVEISHHFQGMLSISW